MLQLANISCSVIAGVMVWLYMDFRQKSLNKQLTKTLKKYDCLHKSIIALKNKMQKEMEEL